MRFPWFAQLRRLWSREQTIWNYISLENRLHKGRSKSPFRRGAGLAGARLDSHGLPGSGVEQSQVLRPYPLPFTPSSLPTRVTSELSPEKGSSFFRTWLGHSDQRPLGTPKQEHPPGTRSAPAATDAAIPAGQDFKIRLPGLGEVVGLVVSLGPQAPAAYWRVTDPQRHREESHQLTSPMPSPMPPQILPRKGPAHVVSPDNGIFFSHKKV